MYFYRIVEICKRKGQLQSDTAIGSIEIIRVALHRSGLNGSRRTDICDL